MRDGEVSCGPDISPLVSSRGKSNSDGDGLAKDPALGESTKETVKPLRGEMAGVIPGVDPD